MSFYSIKIIERSIKVRAQGDLYNRVTHKSWRNAILNLRNDPRSRAVAEFCLATGHDCLRNLPRYALYAALERAWDPHIFYTVLLCSRRLSPSVTERLEKCYIDKLFFCLFLYSVVVF
ncbi:hypothetical protein TNCV_502641 [Trichonephila clavipes]|nr:hypothetical protein TNCV_502641 [Trichonephila clavipes]